MTKQRAVRDMILTVGEKEIMQTALSHISEGVDELHVVIGYGSNGGGVLILLTGVIDGKALTPEEMCGPKDFESLRRGVEHVVVSTRNALTKHDLETPTRWWMRFDFRSGEVRRRTENNGEFDISDRSKMLAIGNAWGEEIRADVANRDDPLFEVA